MRLFKASAKGFLSVGIAVAIAASGVAHAKQLRYAVGFPSGSDNEIAARSYAAAVKEYSDGELSLRVFPMSLLSLAETSAGVRDGLADSGYVLAPYFPAEFPHMNLVAEATMMLSLNEKAADIEGLAYTGAISEFIVQHCPECQTEFKQQNQVFTGGGSSTPYGLMCSKPVKTEADLKGMRIRVAGSQWARWARHMGASPVTMSGNEVFEALQQGVVDCVAISAPELHNLGLLDAVRDITMGAPGGIFAGTAIAQVNGDTWRGLSSKQRTALLRGGVVMSAEATYGYNQSAGKVLEQARNKGVNFHEIDATLASKNEEFIKQDLQALVDYYDKQHRVKRGAEMLAEFRPLLDKWIDLVKDVDSGEALADLYWREVFSKIDVESYGR